MIKNNELVITTKESLNVVRIVTKLDLKDEIVKAVKIYISLNAKKENKSIELRKLIIDSVGFDEYESLSHEEKAKVTEEILNKNIEFKNEMIEIETKANTELAEIGMDLLYNFITRIPTAEKEVYKCLGEIYGKSEKEIANQEADILIEQIQGIAKSKTVQGFFKFAM